MKTLLTLTLTLTLIACSNENKTEIKEPYLPTHPTLKSVEEAKELCNTTSYKWLKVYPDGGTEYSLYDCTK